MATYGVLVISHGSRSEEWVKFVDEAVADVRLPQNVPVFSSFLEIVEGRLIQDGITALEAQGVTDIIVVPLFISSGSTHIDEITYALGVKPEPTLETDMTPLSIHANIYLASPIDDDPDIARILYEKVKELSVNPAKEILLLVGHGSVEKGFHLRWRRGLEALADRIRGLGSFAEADVAMLLPDQVQRKMTWWTTNKPDYTVIVAPLFLSEGYFTNRVIPERLNGYSYKYNGKSMLPHPLISHWMERQIAPLLPIKAGKKADMKLKLH